MHTHFRCPLFFVFLFFSLGIGIHSWWDVSFGILSFMAFVFLLTAVFAFHKPFLATGVLLVGFLFLGALYSASYEKKHKRDVIHIAKYYRRKPVEIKGIVSSEVRKRNFWKGNKTSFVCELKEIKTKWGWRQRQGRILVNLFSEQDISYGDFLLLQGRLHRPYNFSSPNRFSYKEYLRRRGIHLMLSVKKKTKIKVLQKGRGNFLKRIVMEHRKKCKEVLQENLSEGEAGIMQAILVGDKTGIPQHIRALYEHTGTAHILAISGLHVAIVGALFFFLLRLLPTKDVYHYILPIFLLIYYVFLTGARPPVVRAAIMTMVFLLTFVLERESNTLNSLSLAGFLVLLINPLYLMDVGFQLSFCAVCAIILFYQRILEKWCVVGASQDSIALQYILKSFSLSLSAWIGVAGLIAYYFHIVTPVTIIANLFVIPLVTMIVVLGMGLLLVGSFIPFLSPFFACCLQVLLNVKVAIIFLLDKIPGAYYSIKNVNIWYIFSYYSSLLIAILFINRNKKPGIFQERKWDRMAD